MKGNVPDNAANFAAVTFVNIFNGRTKTCQSQLTVCGIIAGREHTNQMIFQITRLCMLH